MWAELIRDLYSRRPETVFSQPLELQVLLWSLGYTDELVNERCGRCGGSQKGLDQLQRDLNLRLRSLPATRIHPPGLRGSS
jgi:hypothetical protein